MSLSRFIRGTLPAAALALCVSATAAIAQSTMAPMKTTTTTTTTKMTPMGGMGKLAANQKFTSEAAAKASCPMDTVVWSSFTSTKSFHMAGSKYYGTTKHGAYVCEKNALAAGYHQSKT